MKILSIDTMLAALEEGDMVCLEHNLVKYGDRVYKSLLPIYEAHVIKGKASLNSIPESAVPKDAIFFAYKP